MGAQLCLDWNPKLVIDKLLYCSDTIIVNPTRCKENLQGLSGYGSKCSSLSDRKNVTDRENICLGVHFRDRDKKNLNSFSKEEVNSHQRLNVGPLISNLNTFNKHSLSENKAVFNAWFTGFTDGDGSFSIINQKGRWSLIFKIGQSTYNLRVLHFIKKQLGCGRIYKEKDGKMADFRIRDLHTINNILIPIFEQNPLLTSKSFNYDKFKKAAQILSNRTYSKSEIEVLLNSLKSTNMPFDYISPAWTLIHNTVQDYSSAIKVMNKWWLIGFTEAEGSFYLVNKSSNRLVHGFEITPKLDKIVLMAIKYLLHISTSVAIKKPGYYYLSTTNSRAIKNIIKYYSNTMKGMKSAEFRIWARAYNNHRTDYLALDKIRKNVRIMKTNLRT